MLFCCKQFMCIMFSKLILLSLITFIGFGIICSAEEEKGKCGHPETDYSPCVTRTRADVLFRQCCQLHVPEECHDLCQYESEEIPARNLKMWPETYQCYTLLRFTKSVPLRKYGERVERNSTRLQQLIDLIIANVHHLNLADNKLEVGDRCLRFYDPAGQGINAISKSDATCLFNLNVILYCHQSALPIRRFQPFYRGPDVGSCQSKHPVLNVVLNPSWFVFDLNTTTSA
uniref:ShKT domain-containing protein n=1 Tax=Wuchereria bancrofti TaxID=6293 RepID=A0A1I8EWM5_WUCBA